MTAKKNKPYKSSIRSEVGYGGCSVLLMSPLIVFALLASMMGVISGLSTMTLGYSSVGITMFVIFGLITVVILSVGWLYIRRLRELYQRARYLHEEQKRIHRMKDTQAAANRLRDKPLSAQGDGRTESISSQQQVN